MKRSVKSLALLLVLCLFVGGYVLAQHLNQDTAQVSQTEGSFALTEHTADEISSLQYTRSEVDYHFIHAGGEEWQLADNAAFPLDADAVQTMADKLVSMKGVRKLTDGIVLSDYGLDTPAFTVTVNWSDGSSTCYAMGNATPFDDGYYLNLDGDGSTIYVISTSLTSIFSKTMNSLAVKETIPSADNVTRIVIGNVLDATWQETSTTIDPDQHWYDTATGAALDDEKIDSLITTANSLSFASVSNALPTAEELEEYHLTEDAQTVITLYSGDEAQRMLRLGADTGSSSYYAMLPDSVIVYTMSSTNVNILLDTQADDLVNRALMPLDYAYLAQADFSGDGIAFTLVPQPPIEEEEAESDEESASGSEDPGEAIWEQVQSLTLTDLYEMHEGTELLTIRADSVNGMSRTLTISTYDVDNYQVSVDGAAAGLVSADGVDKLIRTLKNMK